MRRKSGHSKDLILRGLCSKLEPYLRCKAFSAFPGKVSGSPQTASIYSTFHLACGHLIRCLPPLGTGGHCYPWGHWYPPVCLKAQSEHLGMFAPTWMEQQSKPFATSKPHKNSVIRLQRAELASSLAMQSPKHPVLSNRLRHHWRQRHPGKQDNSQTNHELEFTCGCNLTNCLGSGPFH